MQISGLYRQEPSTKETWDMYRALVTHEDELVNHRLTWYIVVQGLLAAGLFNSFQMLASAQLKAEFARLARWIALGLIILGVVSSWMAFCSIRAALATIDRILQIWDAGPASLGC